MSKEEATQHRRYNRASVELPVMYAAEGFTSARPAKASDIGGGGLRLATEEDLPTGIAVELRFALPNNGREVFVRGRIVLSYFNAIEQLYAHGIAFTGIDPIDQESIVAFIADIQRAK